MKLVMALLILIPLAVMADGIPQFGVSGKVVDTEQEHQVGAATQRALEQQRRSPPAEKKRALRADLHRHAAPPGGQL